MMPRKMEYLSNTSINLFNESVEQFYVRYLSDNRVPNDPQTQPMSVGSAFDAYVKSYLHESLFGKDNDLRFKFDTIFEAQVEKHNRDWAREHGKYCFEQYKSSGALADLMFELTNGQNCRFEFDVQGTVNGYREGNIETISGVTLLGKPDVSFITQSGTHVILDFKVNGYCSKYNTSPVSGYIKIRGAGKTDFGSHKDCFVVRENGFAFNCATTLEVVKKDWAHQLAIYGWLCGEPIGSDFIVGIDQLVCNSKGGGLPVIKIAQHRMKIGKDFQEKIFNRCCEIWEIVNSEHFFRELSFEDSLERCKLLDTQSSITDQWFNEVTKRVR